MKKVVFMFACLLIGVSALAQKKEVVASEIKIKTSSVCGMCKSTIEKDLKYEKGVISSNLEVSTKMLTVRYNSKKTNPEKIKKAVSKIGYDADEVPANPKAYDKLDECCKKNNTTH